MKMNFREVNKKLNEIKLNIERSKARFFISLKYSNQENEALKDLDFYQDQLEHFRNTKISRVNVNLCKQ